MIKYTNTEQDTKCGKAVLSGKIKNIYYTKEYIYIFTHLYVHETKEEIISLNSKVRREKKHSGI